MNFTHPYPYSEGERCGPCLRLTGLDAPATHKIEEATVDIRHPFTQYICCVCFGDMMGPAAIRACALANGEEPPDE